MVKTQAPTPRGSKAGLDPRPPEPPFPNAGGRRPHTSRALGSPLQSSPGVFAGMQGGAGAGGLDPWSSDQYNLGGSGLFPTILVSAVKSSGFGIRLGSKSDLIAYRLCDLEQVI